MFEKMKHVKLNITLSAVLTVILGVVLVIWPGETVETFARIFGVLLLLAGAVLLITALRSFRPALIGALLLLAVGIWAFANPKALTSILPVAAGVLLITHGVQDLALLPSLKRYRADKWGVTILFAIFSIGFGVLCIARAFGIVKLLMVIIGLMLIYDGVTDMVIVRKYNYFRRQNEREEPPQHVMIDAQGKEFLEDSVIDAEFREYPEDDPDKES
ncbi:MAG: DUF308 domain-containing protein [Eubacterium sp.]|nr:DUF308 domain-containing protein [Eubacterium sp.]